LDAVVHSFTQLEIFEARTERQAIAIWLKIDTGMNRLVSRRKTLTLFISD